MKNRFISERIGITETAFQRLERRGNAYLVMGCFEVLDTTAVRENVYSSPEITVYKNPNLSNLTAIISCSLAEGSIH